MLKWWNRTGSCVELSVGLPLKILNLSHLMWFNFKKLTDWFDRLHFLFCCDKGNSLQRKLASRARSSVLAQNIYNSKTCQKWKGRSSLTPRKTSMLKKKQPIGTSCQELGDTLSTTPQCILSMFIHKKQSATLGKHFRDGCATVHVCVHQMEKRSGPMLTHTKYSWKVKLFRRCTVLRVFQEHISTCTNRRLMQTHIKNYLHQLPWGFSWTACIFTDWGREMCKMLGAFSWVEQ